MNALTKLAMVLIPMGILIAAIPDSKTAVEKSDPKQILAEMKDGSHLMTTDVVAEMLVQKDPSLQMIDVRSRSDYEQYHLPGAVNVPLDDILSEENSVWFDQAERTNVLYANGNTAASEAWMLLRQKGYRDIYVMQGGLNNWAETIMNPSRPVPTAPDDELARYDFRRAAGGILGGGVVAPASAAVSAPPPSAPKTTAPRKKRAAGGC